MRDICSSDQGDHSNMMSEIRRFLRSFQLIYLHQFASQDKGTLPLPLYVRRGPCLSILHVCIMMEFPQQAYEAGVTYLHV